MKNTFLQLCFNYLEMTAGFPFFQRFAYAKNRLQTMLQSRVSFFGQQVIGFTKILAPFGVPDHHVAGPEPGQHVRADAFGRLCGK